MDDKDLTEQLHAGFGSTARVVTRRPGIIYQVELPAFLSDGDAATVFVRPDTDGYVLITDLGQTCMRLSYSGAITASVTEAVEQLAERHGFKLDDGQIFARVQTKDLFAYAMALAQTESETEAHIRARAPKEMGAERFKAAVREVLREAFGPRATLDYRSAKDPQGLYTLDAFVRQEHSSVGFALVPSEADAERAVATKLMLAPLLEDSTAGKVRWVALPRDMEKLPKKTQARIESAFEVPIRAIRPGAALSQRLRNEFNTSSVQN
jgi:hypothetical protein